MKRSAEATTRLMNTMWPVVRSESYLRSDSYLSNVSSEGDSRDIRDARDSESKTAKYIADSVPSAPPVPPSTVISMVVDASVSKLPMWNDVVRGVDSFIESHKKAGARAVYSLRTFDTVLYCFKGEKSAKHLSTFVIPEEPEGSLVSDCIEAEIMALKKYQKKHSKFSQVVLLVFTASHVGNLGDKGEKLRNIIGECREKLGWQITLIGADMPTDNMAKGLGIKSVVNCSHASVKDSFRHAAVASGHYRAYSEASELTVDLTAGQPF